MKDFVKFLQFANLLYLLVFVFLENGFRQSVLTKFNPRKCNHRISLVKYFRNINHNLQCNKFLHKLGNIKLPEAVITRCSVKKAFLKVSQISEESTYVGFTKFAGLQFCCFINKRLQHRSFRRVTRHFSRQGSFLGIRAPQQTFYLQRMKERPYRVKLCFFSPDNS